MEKQALRKNFGTFIVIIAPIFTLCVGILGISDFFEDNESISLITKVGIAFLLALLFIMGYLVTDFVLPFLPLTKPSFLFTTISLGWLILLMAFAILLLVNIANPIHSFWLALLNCSMAGWMLANASTHLRAARK